MFVTCGNGNTFILLKTGEVMCCGYNYYGELGIGDENEDFELVSMYAIAPYDKTNAVSISATWSVIAILPKQVKLCVVEEGIMGKWVTEIGIIRMN